MNVPSIETLPWEAGNAQEVKAWVCHVSAGHQGVIEHDKVIALRPGTGTRETDTDIWPIPALLVWGVQDTLIAQYPLEEVWGAWIQWPYRTIPSIRGEPFQQGPRYLLDFGFDQYEWQAPNGATMKRYNPSPPTYSIWCDDADTGGPIMTGSRLRWDGYNSDINGWLRAERVNWHKRRDNSKFPNMP